MYTKKKIAVQKCVYTTPVESRPDQKNLVMWVRLEDLPTDFTLDPNARRADVDSKVAREIVKTLRDAPESFWKLNSGIQMTARDVEVKDGRLVVLEMHDPEDDSEVGDGVINGGHTYACINKVRKEMEVEASSPSDPDERQAARTRLTAVNNAVVRVEVLTGIAQQELADISRARNTGEAVKKFSLQNLKRLYEPIKQVLGAKECERIGFCENDVDLVPGKTFQVLDLVRLMSLFNNALYPYSQDKHPTQCYTSSGRLVDKWESESTKYAPLIPRLKELMHLHDAVYVMWNDWAVSLPQGRRRNGFSKEEHQLPFTQAEVSYKVSTAFVYPVVAALRTLMGPDNEWKTDPQAFLKTAGPGLINTLIAFYDEQCKSKPHELGRSTGAWRAVAAEVRARYAEERLAANG